MSDESAWSEVRYTLGWVGLHRTHNTQYLLDNERPPTVDLASEVVTRSTYRKTMLAARATR